MSFGISACFFVGLEVLNAYFDKTKIPHNYWSDTSLAGFGVYSLFWRRMRTSDFHLFSSLPLSIRRSRCKKYCMLLVTYNLFLELYLEILRKKFLLRDHSLYSNLTEQELIDIQNY